MNKTRPVCLRSADEEERWWSDVACSRGMTLAEFDARISDAMDRNNRRYAAASAARRRAEGVKA